MYFILTWDISETRFDGPYDSPEDAFSKLDDLPDEYLENTAVVGPLPTVSRVK